MIKAKSRGFMFDEVQFSTPDKSAFDLSHRNVLTAQFDYLYPILTHECLPGETYELNSNMFFRTSPIVAPLMQNIDVKVYYFWIPNRVIWRGWRKFISNGDGTISNDSELAGKNILTQPFITNYDLHYRGNFSLTSYYRKWRSIRPVSTRSIPIYGGGSESIQAYTDGMYAGSLADYFSIPYDMHTSESNQLFTRRYDGHNTSWTLLRTSPDVRTYSSLPFRAYNKIWYDWFRDENVFSNPNDTPLYYQIDMTSPVSTSRKLMLYNEDKDYYNDLSTDPWDSNLNVGLLKKCWSKDYLTSALTNPQRGDDVILPLGDTAPLKFDSTKGTTKVVTQAGGSSIGQHSSSDLFYTNSDGTLGIGPLVGGQAPSVNLDITKNTYVDLSNATSATLNSLRVANAFQKFLEKMARCGSRYVESMQAYFDVQVPDSASNRTTLISTARIPLNIQTNSSQEAAHVGDGVVIPQGTQVANGSGNGSVGFKFTTDEHGFIIGLMCIEPTALYGSSLPRFYFRRTYLDYAWPMFANLGEQEVYLSELCPTYNSSLSDDVDLNDYDISLTKEDVANMKPFGYQSRYCEYKYVQDSIHGRMKDDYNYYHLARYATGINQNPHPLSRQFLILDNEDRQNIFNEVIDENGGCQDHFLFDIYHDFKGIRPLPLYGTPSL